MPRSRARRLFGCSVVAVVLAVGLVPFGAATPAGAAVAPVYACPPGAVPLSPFVDIDFDTHVDSIDCVVWWGVAKGTGPWTYNPGAAITRAQLATMLRRVLELTGDLPASVPRSMFTDVSPQEIHRPGIDALAYLGIVTGREDRFLPGEFVTRDQMATMLVNLLERVYGIELSSGEPFADTAGNVHEANITKLAGAGITTGTGPGTYGPAERTTRGQMATIVMRAIDILAERGVADAPAIAQDECPVLDACLPALPAGGERFPVSDTLRGREVRGRYDGFPGNYADEIEANIESAGWTIVGSGFHNHSHHYWVAVRPGLYLTASAEHVEFTDRDGVAVAIGVEPEGRPAATATCTPIERCFPGAPSKARWTGSWVPFDGVGVGASYSVIFSPQPLVEAIDANIRAAGWTITAVEGNSSESLWSATRPGLQLIARLMEYLDRVDYEIRPS